MSFYVQCVLWLTQIPLLYSPFLDPVSYNYILQVIFLKVNPIFLQNLLIFFVILFYRYLVQKSVKNLTILFILFSGKFCINLKLTQITTNKYNVYILIFDSKYKNKLSRFSSKYLNMRDKYFLSILLLRKFNF